MALAHRLAVALAAAALLGGCAEKFVPASVVQDLRVLALVADPPEVGAGEDVTVRPALAWPDPEATTAPTIAFEAWSFCPFSLGASAGYACAVPACEVPLTPAAGAVTFPPATLAETCLDLLGGTLPGGAGIPARVETVVRYVASDGTTRREAVQRLPVTTSGPPQPRNRPPVITGVTVGGQPGIDCGQPGAPTPCPASATWDRAARLPFAAAIDPASIDTYLDGTGRLVTEQVVISFFTTAGRFTEERGEAPLATTELKDEEVPADTTRLLLWAVARDLRGGEAVAGPFAVDLAP